MPYALWRPDHEADEAREANLGAAALPSGRAPASTRILTMKRKDPEARPASAAAPIEDQDATVANHCASTESLKVVAGREGRRKRSSSNWLGGLRGLMAPAFVAALTTLSLTAMSSDLDPLDHWTVRYELGGPGQMTCVCRGDTLFVAVVAGPPRLIASGDGVTWTDLGPSPVDYVRSMVHGNGRFVGCGKSSLLTSIDGTNWVTRALNANADLYDLTFGAGLFVATGMNGTTASTWTSPDALNWVEHQISDEVSLGGGGYGAGGFCVAGRLIRTGGPLFAKSADGFNWEVVLLPDTLHVAVNDVAYGAGLWVAVGSRVLVSADATRWEEINYGFGTAATRIHYINGRFYALNGGGPHASADGRNWLEHDTTFQKGFSTYTAWVYDLSLGNGRFVAASGASGLGPVVVQSGAISGMEQDVAALAVGLFPGVSITGQVGRLYRIEASDRAEPGATWTPVGKVLLPSTPFRWFDESNSAGGASRYYRAVLVD